jgi:hypothetical protein
MADGKLRIPCSAILFSGRKLAHAGDATERGRSRRMRQQVAAG